MLKIIWQTLIIIAITNNIATASNSSETAEEREVFNYFNNENRHNDMQYFSHVNPDAPKGGKVKYGIEGTFDTLNHYLSNGIKAAGYYLITATPMYRSPEHVAKYYPYIAEKYIIPNDYSYIIFKIRNNATWSNGKPILAKDFVFSLNALKEKGNTFMRINYDDITHAEIIDKRTVKMYLRYKNRKDLLLTIFSMPIYYSEQYSNLDDSKISSTPPITSGPYKITRFELGQHITYEKIADHWTSSLEVFKGRTNFQTIQVEYYRDNASLVQALKAGAIDLRLETISKNWIKNYNIPELEQGKLHKRTFNNTLPTGMSGLVFNTRRYPFNNREIRKAISYALDFAWINKNLMYNSYVRNLSYYTNSIYDTTGQMLTSKEMKILQEYKESLPPEIFTQPFILPNSKLCDIKKNLKTAMEILKKNGWHIVNNKLVNGNNKQLTIEMLHTSKNFHRVSAAFARNLEKLGIKIIITTVEPVNYRTKIHNFNFDMILDYFPFKNVLRNEQINYWHSKLANLAGSRNYAGIQNPVVDSLLNNLSNTTDNNELVALAHALDRVLLFNYYIIPCWRPKSLRFIYWDTVVPPKDSPQYELDLESWWAAEQNINSH
ncbi:putative Solute-binding protein family 5 domain-containing protein [Candidatus Xenohaliotis californiensis]|uniref:Solute-binding protein family 5 domain-containing protein n=1 Tax=Candidatus Xenohaliotis californiensis TaxID=84677 RepID=A0ABP0EWL9_9RICK|nr:putative Solute-binding protein family 5 domain-containing protein [Candidatus Xenohaliotis californiensis]